MRGFMLTAMAAAVFGLGACGQKTTAPAADAPIVAAPPAIYTPEGPAQEIALADAEGLQTSASVTEVVFLENPQDTTVKIFSTAGGDPAINGLYTYVAAHGPATGDGWNVFFVGDFNSWKLAQENEKDFVLTVSRSTIDAAGEIATAEESLRITTPGPETTALPVQPVRPPPETVVVTSP